MRKLLIIAAAVLLFAGFQVRREKWEYKVLNVAGMETSKELNAAGADGWELVNAEFNGLTTVCFLKRRN